ncbi:MAG: response regulator [Elusimicrobia bacterium]|nr:response regulator [Elusimicrobiota bacterium]
MKRILVVDDDRLILDMVCECLKKAGFSVESAETGVDGLAKAAGFKPDLVVLDLMMPDMHGFDVCQALRKDAAPDAPKVLILTAKNYEIDRRAAQRLGAEAYVSKPFRVDELLETVNRLLAPSAS